MARWCNILGLLCTLVGAIVTASGVFISRHTAEGITGAAIGSNPGMNDLLVHQSETALVGLIFIAVGTALQLVAVFLPSSAAGAGILAPDRSPAGKPEIPRVIANSETTALSAPDDGKSPTHQD